jgi:transcriptional regulator with XRE-family HTH domain
MADGGKSPADIGRRIAALRLALDKNQSAFAALVGLTQPALNNYERGLRRPELDKAMLIVARTGVTLDWLYLGERSGLPQRLLELIAAFDQSEPQAERQRG